MAECALQARVVQPLDTDGLADLAVLVCDTLSTGNDVSGTFVAANERKFCWDGPVTIHSVKICVADTRVLDVHKNFTETWLGYWDLLILDRSSDLLDRKSVV